MLCTVVYNITHPDPLYKAYNWYLKILGLLADSHICGILVKFDYLIGFFFSINDFK